MSVEGNNAADGQGEEHAEEEEPSPRQDPPNIKNQGKIQADASLLEQLTIRSEGERSGLQQEGDLTLETPNNVLAQPKTNDKRQCKTRKQKSESKEGSSKKSKERHEKL